mgnify:CR=1 FL=1
MGITKELFIFLSAILSGAIVRLVYRCISCLRNVIHHTHWIIELEDLAYWVGTAIFLFVQIYYTSSGSVRWYFVLGWAWSISYVGFSSGCQEVVSKNCMSGERVFG